MQLLALLCFSFVVSKGFAYAKIIWMFTYISYYDFLYLFLSFLIFWLHWAACGVLIPQFGFEPVPPAVEAWSLNHWASGEVQLFLHLILYFIWMHFNIK